MKKKTIFAIIGSVLILTWVFWIIQKDQDEATQEPEQTNENKQTDTDNQEEDTNENDDAVPVSWFGQFEYYGKECVEIDDTIERGDCFQEVGEEYIEWYLNEDKNEFYFPYQREQSHWKDVFYKEIDEDDQLGELIEAEYFDEYEDPYAHETNYDRGEKVLDTYWYVFSNLIPRQNREKVEAFYWTDTGDDLVFAVGHNDPDSMYILFSHLIPQQYYPSTRYLLLHEYGHVLTLNDTQIHISEDIFEVDDEEWEELQEEIEANCKTLYLNGRCAKEDSYIYDYYNEFWSDLDEPYNAIDWNNEHDYEEFFFEYEDHFFNSYQGTSVAEDIADTFAYFVHSHSSITENSGMKYEKIDFFYNHEELVELRTAILENIYHLSVKDEEFY